MPIWNLTLLSLALVCMVPMTVWAVECAAALLPKRKSVDRPGGRRPGITLLIPAHNEAGGIRATLENLSSQLCGADHMVVVADNCTDRTADIARQCGATVIERHEPERRGKSHALEFGIRSLKEDSTEVVIVIDADCAARPGAIARLAQMAFDSGRPVQASYYLQPPEAGESRHRMAALAFTIKNVVRPGGLARLGLPCFLNGSGMAFPAGTIRSINWANGRIAEDKWMTVDMALAGHVPVFCEESRICSRLPAQSGALTTQSTRWLHGHLEAMLVPGPRLIWGAIRQRRPELLALALDLLVPPFSLLILLWLAGMSMSVAAGLLGAAWTPAALLAAGGALAGASFAAAAWRFGDGGLWKPLAAAPGYVLSRIPLLAAFLVRRQRHWIPTERDSRHAGDE